MFTLQSAQSSTNQDFTLLTMRLLSCLLVTLLTLVARPSTALSPTAPHQLKSSQDPPSDVTVHAAKRNFDKTTGAKFLRTGNSDVNTNRNVRHEVDEERGLSNLSAKISEKLKRILTGQYTPEFIYAFGAILSKIIHQVT
ncbi:putative RxLR effector [Phytophthora palmivora]|uniref:RxLR effector protein n=1 Tax=Phytophthora palmivora TaxID=4796 RepID=A0A2P4X5D4_9STRA|nr:putative RxLR effector [Phytophthora palmivora]